MNMNRKLLCLAVSLLVLGSGAVVAAQADPGGDEAGDPSSELAASAVLDDWCQLMALAFGPGLDSPSVEASFRNALLRKEAAPEVAFVALLEGIPPGVARNYEVVRAAGLQIVDDTAVANPDEVVASAGGVDSFIAESCDT